MGLPTCFSDPQATRMDGDTGVKEFLGSSTIHGLSYIAANRRFVRLFWICVVLAGFAGAAYLIQQSFSSWAVSPITTTIETRPITEIDFPNVTVCPPRNSFTSLIPDLVTSRNITFSQDDRKELSDVVADALLDASYDVQYKEFIEYRQDTYIDWYTGISSTTNVPYNELYFNKNRKKYNLITARPSGSFSTENFRKPLSDHKFELVMMNDLDIYFPTKGRVQNRK